MEKLKFYINNMDELNEYEKEHNKISIKRLINHLFTDIILCNDITKLFYTDINGNYIEPDVEIGTEYNEENEEYIDIYQYFIVNFPSYIYSLFEQYKEELGNEFILYYINELDMYVLGVTHFGTSWDYVLTDIEPTTKLEEANL